MIDTSSSETSSIFERLIAGTHGRHTAWVVLVASLILTVSACYLSMRFTEQLRNDKLDFRAKEITTAIDYRLSYYEQSLWGGVGLFNASENVTGPEWKAYVDALNIDAHLPGIQGMGYSLRIPPSLKEKHIGGMRALGFPDYSINPEGERDLYSSIIFLEPFDWRNRRAFGFDMWSEPNRRAAMTRAGDTGEAAMSAAITLVQETENDVQRGFLSYLPVYKNGSPITTLEERREALVGWVYSPFRMGDLMDGVLGSNDEQTAIEIFDGPAESAESLLYASQQLLTSGKNAVDRVVQNIELQGRVWTVAILTARDPNESRLPLLILIGGIAVNSLLFLVIYSISSLHERAKKLAGTMTIELKEKTRHLEKANQELKQFAYASTHDIRSPINNIGNALRLLDREDLVLSERGEKAMFWMKNGHEKVIEILDKLIEIIRIRETGRIEAEVLDVRECTEHSLIGLRGLLDDGGGQIDLSKSGGTLVFPREVLARVLENLLSNAIKYRDPDRDLKVEVIFEELKNSSRLTVRDNGLGFDNENDKERVFGLFKRAHDHVSGSGFGLYITKDLLEAHSAELDCDSEIGVGSTFVVSFPPSPVE